MSIKIGNIDVSHFKVGGDDCSIYLGSEKLYPTTPPTPTGSTCYEVINDPITAYTATTYDSVYSFAESKWYMKNNLNQYEEYGIYDTATTLSDLTYYEGKLAVVGTTEYKYSGGSWKNVGTYITTEITYDIPSGYSTTYQGQTIPTTFKISVADMNVLGTRYISIYDNTNTSYYLRIGKTSYLYYGSPRITGTVTSDSDYYYFTLTDAKPSIEIYRTRGYNGTVHIIAEQSTPSVLYTEKDMPLAKAYQSVAAMESEVCPTVGVGQYGVVGSAVYQFDSTELWVTAGDHYKVFEKNSSGEVNVVGCNSSSTLTTGDTKPNYFDYSGITETIIGDCTTSIGTSAFTNCISLSSCTIGSGVASIGDRAFYNCSGLTSIAIPSGVTSIGNYAFQSCSGLTSVTIPDSVTSIGTYAFNGCSSLPIYESFQRYADTYLVEATGNRQVYTLKSGTRFIGDKAFSGNPSTIIVRIPDSVISIGEYAFSGTALGDITIPSGVTRIANGVFDGCESNLRQLNIPDSVTSIGTYAFRNCLSLTSCTIGNGVTSIGAYAFNNCYRLPSITIPSGVTYISNDMFNGCSGLTSVDIPNSVTGISSNAFTGCKSLTSVTIPSGVTSISSNAFTGCKSLTSVTIPSGVTSIGASAFSGCTALSSISIPSGVTTINATLFVSCSSLTALTLSDRITYINYAAFWGCSNLRNLTIYATTPPTLGTDVFKYCNNLTIYVPAASVDTYKAATNWSTYASRIQAIPNS